jgi:hypothetical protein
MLYLEVETAESFVHYRQLKYRHQATSWDSSIHPSPS